jgi:hypothetical protein
MNPTWVVLYALVRIWDTLDLDEIWELAEDFLFMATAVLITGNTESFVGSAFAKYCSFINLGWLLMDTNQKLGYPLSKLLIRLVPFLPETNDEKMDEDLLAMAKVSAMRTSIIGVLTTLDLQSQALLGCRCKMNIQDIYPTRVFAFVLFKFYSASQQKIKANGKHLVDFFYRSARKWFVVPRILVQGLSSPITSDAKSALNFEV